MRVQFFSQFSANSRKEAFKVRNRWFVIFWAFLCGYLLYKALVFGFWMRINCDLETLLDKTDDLVSFYFYNSMKLNQQVCMYTYTYCGP